MKTMTTLLLSLAFLNCDAQIVLKGYKCLFYEEQIPFLTAEMYSKNDTFMSILYTRDIWAALDGKFATKKEQSDPQNELVAGLELCFDGWPYTKTKDSLYVSTQKIDHGNVFLYKVYIPEQFLSISVRSAKNNEAFSNKSKWLLAQIRQHRWHKDELILMNEKNQNCLDPYNKNHDKY
jgi:hypothetical protein